MKHAGLQVQDQVTSYCLDGWPTGLAGWHVSHGLGDRMARAGNKIQDSFFATESFKSLNLIQILAVEEVEFKKKNEFNIPVVKYCETVSKWY